MALIVFFLGQFWLWHERDRSHAGLGLLPSVLLENLKRLTDLGSEGLRGHEERWSSSLFAVVHYGFHPERSMKHAGDLAGGLAGEAPAESGG